MTRTTSIQQTVADAQLYLLLQPPVSPRRLSQASTTSVSVADAADHDASSSVASNNDIGDDIGDDIGALSDFASIDDIMTTSATTSTATTATARLTRAGTMTQTIADAAQFLALPCAPTTDTAAMTADSAVMTRGRERRMRDCPARNLRSRSKQHQ